MAAAFATERWTLKRIAALIEREFGVRYHPRYLERPLKAHGFSVQRPATRAKEHDEFGIAGWPKRAWVVLKKGVPGAPDPGPLGQDRPQLPRQGGHDLARRGLTPRLRRVNQPREVSSVVAVTPDGRPYARQFRTSVLKTVISALRSFRRQTGTPLLVARDRLNAHRLRATLNFITATRRTCGGFPVGLRA